MEDASLAVIVVQSRDTGPPSPSAMNPFVAFVAGNPSLRASGATEEEAVDRLRYHILSFISKQHTISAKVIEMRFDELIVSEIMER